MATDRKLRFFLDNNVPDEIAVYLRGRTHSVYVQRYYIPHDSPDHLVAETAMQDNRILVTQDKDFNNQRFQKSRFSALSRVSLVGQGPTLAAAIREHIHLIEAQWDHKVRTGATRMIAHVQIGQIKFRA